MGIFFLLLLAHFPNVALLVAGAVAPSGAAGIGERCAICVNRKCLGSPSSLLLAALHAARSFLRALYAEETPHAHPLSCPWTPKAADADSDIASNAETCTFCPTAVTGLRRHGFCTVVLPLVGGRDPMGAVPDRSATEPLRIRTVRAGTPQPPSLALCCNPTADALRSGLCLVGVGVRAGS
jgi:hypothetical protein